MTSDIWPAYNIYKLQSVFYYKTCCDVAYWLTSRIFHAALSLGHRSLMFSVLVCTAHSRHTHWSHIGDIAQSVIQKLCKINLCALQTVTAALLWRPSLKCWMLMFSDHTTELSISMPHHTTPHSPPNKAMIIHASKPKPSVEWLDTAGTATRSGCSLGHRKSWQWFESVYVALANQTRWHCQLWWSVAPKKLAADYSDCHEKTGSTNFTHESSPTN